MPVLPAVIGWIPALVGVTAQLDYARVTRCNWTMPVLPGAIGLSLRQGTPDVRFDSLVERWPWSADRCNFWIPYVSRMPVLG